MRISDPKTMLALAHPLRLDLLELLGTGGPATAAQCGRALGVPQANASFHLRQLAKYGLVEDAGHGKDRRERLWRVVDAGAPLRLDVAGGAVAQRQLERVVVEREARAILDSVDRKDRDSREWRDVAGTMTAVAVLSAADAAEIRRQWQALLEPFLAGAGSAPGPGQRRVRYFLAATPLPEAGIQDEEFSDD